MKLSFAANLQQLAKKRPIFAKESKEFRNIGSWWQSKKEKDPCEIDIIGIYADDKHALVAEVKRQRKNFNPDYFNEKVEIVRNKVLSKYNIEVRNFCMEDM